MGTTREFYSANAEEFVQLVSQEEDWERENYPQADFSLHLILPDDMDTLCRVMRLQRLNVPHSFANLVGERLWSDEDGSAWLARVSKMLAPAMASLSDNTIAQITTRWVQSYCSDLLANPDHYTDAYRASHQALSDLRAASQDALTAGRELLLYCVGIEMSWPGWYHER